MERMLDFVKFHKITTQKLLTNNSFGIIILRMNKHELYSEGKDL
jgi:hypothetical protein